MDLSTLDVASTGDKGQPLHLKHPGTGVGLIDEATGKPVEIVLLSADSTTFTRLSHQQQNERIKKMRGRGKIATTSQEVLEDSIELLAAVTKSWSGIVLDGKPLECSPANAKALYTRLPWVREQADDFVNDRVNFLGNS